MVFRPLADLRNDKSCSPKLLCGSLIVSWRVLSHRLLAVTDQRFFVGHLGIKSSRKRMAVMASALVLMGLMRPPDLKAYNSQNMGNQRDSI